ncbi:YkoF family thiamine/hydroxymethylpyrimidine-binding protein [Flavobacteriaceae bacterium S356]|uniref:YkoF family thiamine/hydroxymethylpyrimidine-binding protein n=1 Tax=Asprobacillus argus TaxID=3076534 RepID=A0ABU3LCW7_9FLAO|nr:YkoF family thiamine/hydroxymethylpyrimidine-binding protein [Flavobacteriaceae bacterium S356]
MKISVELTLLPLQNDFETPIINFIKALRNSDFTVLENPLSTQIYGDFNTLMPFLTDEIRNSFEHQEHVVVNMKIVKSDRSTYEPTF